MTTSLLEFDDMHISSVNAQMSRGKTERFIAAGLGSIASTLARMSMDITLFMSTNFDFLTLPNELTTGSSIMPHKKNPDAIEMIRAKCNRISSTYNEIILIMQNLPSGYHRDYQLLKEIIFPAYQELFDCLQITGLVMNHLIINREIISDEKYRYIFSVENINDKVSNKPIINIKYDLLN